MAKYEIITYSRSTGDITHSKRLYSTRWNDEAALRTEIFIEEMLDDEQPV